MPYNIFLVDIVDVLDSNKRAKVKGILDGYFGKVFAHRPELANTFGSPTCSFSTDPKPTTREMLCYICPPNKSVVAKFVGESDTFTFLESHWGRTSSKRVGTKSVSASEVLARNTFGDQRD